MAVLVSYWHLEANNSLVYSCFVIFGFRSKEATITVARITNTVINEVTVGM